LETVPFSGNAQQVFLLAYRAVCKEVYAKLGHADVMAFGKTLDRGFPIECQIAIQHQFGVGAYAGSIGLRDLTEHKKRLDVVLQAGDFSDMHALVIEVAETPSFLCSGAIFPEYDFSGHALQNLLDVKQILEMVTFSLIATDTGGAVVFAWLGDQPSVENLCKSLEPILDRDLPDAVARFTFEFFENVVMAPDWWESLSREVQERLTLRFMTQTGAEFPRSPTCLSPDGVHSVAWSVTSRRCM
jgi:hypothetical protein